MDTEIIRFINKRVFVDEDSYNRFILLISRLSVEDLLFLSRFTYTNCEEPLLEDYEYDRILKDSGLDLDSSYESDDYQKYSNIIKLFNVNSDLKGLNKLNNGNDIEKEKLFNKFGPNRSFSTFSNLTEACQFLLPNITNTVIEFSDYDESFIHQQMGLGDYYHNIGKAKFLLSMKHDGWNITTYYKKGYKKCFFAHTRGRDGAAIKDCTKIMQMILPEIEVEEDTKIVGELIIPRSKLPYLKDKYKDRKWVNIRNSVSTFIAGNLDDEDLKIAEFIAFEVMNSKYKDATKVSKFAFLSSKGFIIPKFFITDLENITYGIRELEKYYIDEYSLEYECDGVIISYSDIKVAKKGNEILYKNIGTFSCAFKGFVWDSEILEAEIKRIYLGDSKKYFTPKAELIPIKSRSGSIISNVGLNNLRLIEKYWLMPGDRIKIRYHSQQNVYFMYKIEGMTKKEYIEKYRKE